jgi:hypothetical protein
MLDLDRFEEKVTTYDTSSAALLPWKYLNIMDETAFKQRVNSYGLSRLHLQRVESYYLTLRKWLYSRVVE